MWKGLQPMTARGANKENGSAFLRYVSLGAFAGLLLFLSDGICHVVELIGAGIPSRYFLTSALCAGVCCGFFYSICGALSASADYPYFGIKAGSMAVFGFAARLLTSYL
jgi:hypothetical protein